MPRIDSLPFRLQTEPGDEPVVCIDGLCGTGLHLSHWPGNETPAHLKHDLSTGIALNFARLDAAAQDALVGDAVAVINNHVDTDGCLALLATLRPEVALGHAQLLHEVAEAGDFFRAPSERSVGLDAAIEAMLSSEHSPWRERWRGCTPQQRHEQATLEMLSALPAILDGRDSDANELAQLALLSFQSDRADLASCALDELVHLSLQVWIAPYGASSTRAANDISGSPRGFGDLPWGWLLHQTLRCTIAVWYIAKTFGCAEIPLVAILTIKPRTLVCISRTTAEPQPRFGHSIDNTEKIRLWVVLEHCRRFGRKKLRRVA